MRARRADAEYEIVRYSPTHRSQVLELQRHLWSDDLAVNDAYLAWKYERNPYAEEPRIYLALHRDEVVGMRGLYGVDWVVGLEPRPVAICALCAGDLVIAPEHRSRGVFTRLFQFVDDDLAGTEYQVLLNLSASSATRLGSVIMGWRCLAPLTTMARTMRRGDSSDAPIADEFEALDAARLPDHVTLADAPRPEAMTDLVRRLGSDGRIRHRRNEVWFSWRFANPLARHRFLFWDDGALEGYLVLCARRLSGDRNVAILDWEGSTPEVSAALLETATGPGRLRDLRIWSVSLPGEAIGLLQRCEFRELPATRRWKGHNPALLVRPVGKQATDPEWTFHGRHILELGDWDLRMAFSDTR